MGTLTLSSCLATQIRSFIDLRCLSGTDYKSQAQLLGYFDRFLVEQNLRELHRFACNDNPFTLSAGTQRYTCTPSL